MKIKIIYAGKPCNCQAYLGLIKVKLKSTPAGNIFKWMDALTQKCQIRMNTLENLEIFKRARILTAKGKKRWFVNLYNVVGI